MLRSRHDRRKRNDGMAASPDACEGIAALLIEALQKLADTGEVDAACRIAGKACTMLRHRAPASEQRFNVLLHRLARKLAPAMPKGGKA